MSLKYTKEEVQCFYDYYADNHKIKEVAEHFNVSYRDVLHS